MSGAGRRPAWPVRRLPERGSATVEFLGAALVLLVPLVYLVLVLGQVQAATFAAEAGAREAGRVVARAADLATAQDQARTAVQLAFADQGLDVVPAVRLTCTAQPCLTPGSGVHVTVTAHVELPLVPAFVAGALPAGIGVEAAHLAAVDRFRERS